MERVHLAKGTSGREDLAFHLAIYDATHNPLFRQLLGADARGVRALLGPAVRPPGFRAALVSVPPRAVRRDRAGDAERRARQDAENPRRSSKRTSRKCRNERRPLTSFDQASLIVAHDEGNAFDAVVPPIVQTSLFTFASYDEMAATYRGEKVRPTYTRGLNPTVRMFEEMLAEARRRRGRDRLCQRHGGDLVGGARPSSSPATASSRSGNVYPDAFRLFGTLLKRMRHRGRPMSTAATRRRSQAALPGAKLLYLESPTSWVMEAHDVGALAALAKRARHPRRSSTTAGRRRSSSGRCRSASTSSSTRPRNISAATATSWPAWSPARRS